MTYPEAGGAGSGEGGLWRWRRSPEGCQWSGCGRDRHGGGVRGGQRSGEGVSWWRRRRSGGGDDGSGGGDGVSGGGDGVGEAGQRKGVERSPDWQAGDVRQGGARPAGAPSQGEAAGRRTWMRRNDGGRDGGGGGRSGGGGGDGEIGRTGSASQHLSAGTTGRGSCSRLPPACRVSQRKSQGLLNPLPPLCRNRRRLPVSCHMKGFRCGMGGEVAVSDWLSS